MTEGLLVVTKRGEYCGCWCDSVLYNINTDLISVQCGVCPLQCYCEGRQHHRLHTHWSLKRWCYFLLNWAGAHLFIHWLALSHTIEGPQANHILCVWF